jgi:glycosyltransferase involved in cell wall biosynthesis
VRILHTLASPYWSGPAENVAQLALAQRALGHEVAVAIDRRRNEGPTEEIARPHLEALGLLDDGGLELSVKSPPTTMYRDMRRLRSLAVDVVHCHFTHDHFIARWGRPQRARLIRSIHAPRSIRRTLPVADAYTVPFAGLLGSLARRRTVLLPALVSDVFRPPEDRESLRRELGIEGRPVIGMVSTFKPSRNHRLALEAFKVYRREHGQDAVLVLVGDGEERDGIKSLANSAGLGATTVFSGYQSGPAFVRWLQALDVAWILGLGNDWSARAAAQAQACDVRVVAVDEGALPSYADAVVTLDPADIARATASVRALAKPRESNEAIARAMLDLYVGR